ncbi:MAG: carbohydrate binding domain-containing protein, partial [Acholeplasmataceae bacterium]|nr:carbohydrate binding domain-containing protein [Acholeplasmataceae bacterium]
MKRLFVLMLMLVVSFSLASCVEPADDTDEGEITWTGLEDKTITRGDTVDLLEGITAVDSIDGSLTSEIVIEDVGDFTSHLAGGYTVTYTVENSTGVVSTQTKDFTVLVGHNVANGDFSMGQYGWTLDKPGGDASVAYADGEAVITISNAGTSWWGLQLKQENLVFQANTTYKATVVASSPDERSISFGYEDPNDGFRMLNPGFMAISLGTDETTYEMYFTSTENYTNIKAVVYLGNQLENDTVGEEAHVVNIHSIYIEEVTLDDTVTFDGMATLNATSGNVDFNPLNGVSVSNEATITVLGEVPETVKVASTYYVTYLVEMPNGSIAFATKSINITLAKDFEYQAINGDFENGFTGWTQDVIQTQGTGAATFTDNEDGTVSILVTNVSSAAWHIQLQQATSTFKEGESYVVFIRLKASEERKVNVEVVHPASDFASIANPLVNVEVGTDWTEYEIHFSSDQDYSGAKLGLLLGNGDGLQSNNITVTVDKFQVYRYGPFNEEFDTEHAPWVLDNITGSVNEHGEMVVVFAENQVGAMPWNNQLYQSSGSELVDGHTYEIEVRIKSSIARTIRAWIED